jgi:hypothetical protein
MYNEATNSEKANRAGVSARSIILCLIVAAGVFVLSLALVAYNARLLLAVTFVICVITATVLAWRRSINIGIALCIAFFGPMVIVLICDRLLPFSRPIYCTFVHETPAEFWQWFGKHSLDIRRGTFRFEDDLHKHIRRVDPRLHCEISNIQSDGCQTLTISPGQDRDALPIAERVVSEAPHLRVWHVVACRQRQPLETELGGYPTMECLETDYPGCECYQTQDILFALKDGGRRVNIELYLKRDKIGLGDDQCHQLAEKMIEDSLGERDCMLLVDKIDVFSGDIKIPSNARPISELPTAFDHWAGTTKRDCRSADEGFSAPMIRSHKGLK